MLRLLLLVSPKLLLSFEPASCPVLSLGLLGRVEQFLNLILLLLPHVHLRLCLLLCLLQSLQARLLRRPGGRKSLWLRPHLRLHMRGCRGYANRSFVSWLWRLSLHCRCLSLRHCALLWDHHLCRG